MGKVFTTDPDNVRIPKWIVGAVAGLAMTCAGLIYKAGGASQRMDNLESVVLEMRKVLSDGKAERIAYQQADQQKFNDYMLAHMKLHEDQNVRLGNIETLLKKEAKP